MYEEDFIGDRCCAEHDSPSQDINDTALHPFLSSMTNALRCGVVSCCTAREIRVCAKSASRPLPWPTILAPVRYPTMSKQLPPSLRVYVRGVPWSAGRWGIMATLDDGQHHLAYPVGNRDAANAEAESLRRSPHSVSNQLRRRERQRNGRARSPGPAVDRFAS